MSVVVVNEQSLLTIDGKTTAAIVSEKETVSVENDVISVVGVGIQGAQGIKGDYPVAHENFLLTDIDLLNKYIELGSEIVSNQNTQCFIKNGSHGVIGYDYSISGQHIYWNGYKWDGLLSAGDEIEVFYVTN